MRTLRVGLFRCKGSLRYTFTPRQRRLVSRERALYVIFGFAFLEHFQRRLAHVVIVRIGNVPGLIERGNHTRNGAGIARGTGSVR